MKALQWTVIITVIAVVAAVIVLVAVAPATAAEVNSVVNMSTHHRSLPNVDFRSEKRQLAQSRRKVVVTSLRLLFCGSFMFF